VSRTPGFPRALARTLLELRLAGVGRAALDGLPLGGRDLGELLDRFDAQFAAASATDRAALFDAATAALGAGPTPWSGLPLLLLDVPVESAIELAFVRALVGASTDALATVPFGDIAALEALKGIAGRDADVVEQKGTSDLAALRRYLFARTPPPGRARAGDVRFLSAPGEGRECVEIARRMLEEAGAGVRFDEMAVFLRAPQHYLGLLEHALARAEIPAYFDRGTRRPHPAGRAFLALLGCAVEKLSARRFAEYLSLGQVPQVDVPAPGLPAPVSAVVIPTEEEFVVWADAAIGADSDSPDPALESSGPKPQAPSPKPPAPSPKPQAPGPKPHAPGPDSDDVAVVEGTLRAPWKWEQLIVESSVIGGDPRRWHRRLDGLANEYRLKIKEAAKEEPESPRVRRLERDRRNLAHLRAFALPIVDELASWPAAAPWGEWLDRFERLVPSVLRHPERVLRVLADLRPMAGIGPVALDEARDVLADRLRSLEAEPPRARYGRVFVGSPHQARGRGFRVAFVPGLAERMFPQRPREDPMLLDDLRKALAAGGPALVTQDDRARTERLLLRLAAGASTDRLYLSYPRLDIAESRPRVPSFYALDVMRAIEGRIPAADELTRGAAGEGAASLAWPAPADPARAIDDLEHDLAVLKSLLDADDRATVRGHAHYLLRLNDALRRSVSARWARGRSAWTPYDGIVRVTAATRPALDGQRLGTRPYSLSALQKFSVCPYQFLLSAVYRLEPTEEPEPLQTMDPLTRGSIFHRIQAEFFRTLEAGGALPVTGATLPRALAVLDDTIARVAAEERDRLAPAIDRVWHDEIAGIAKDLRVWVRRLPEKAPDEDDWDPMRFEFSFGLSDEGRDPRSVPDPVRLDGRFLLRGSVDLVEERRGDRALRITDHKTGKDRSTPRLVIGGGAMLQPVLYSLAVAQALDRPVVAGRLYYCTSAGGFHAHAIPINDTTRRLGIEALEIVDRAVELGFLPAAPAERACSWCDFRPVCGPHEEQRIARCKPREKLGDLDALRGKP
jgi:hypothetical protein